MIYFGLEHVKLGMNGKIGLKNESRIDGFGVRREGGREDVGALIRL